VLIVLAAVAVVVSSLPVEVNEYELRWSFGPGLWTLSIARRHRNRRDRAQSLVERLRNQGTLGFRLYNESGLDAVELQLKSHDIRRIGTDDPQSLANALKAFPRRG
jgi:hypothetical protein